MHGTAHRQHGSNLKVIAVGNLNPPLYAIKNMANGYVLTARYTTSKEAQAHIDALNGAVPVTDSQVDGE